MYRTGTHGRLFRVGAAAFLVAVTLLGIGGSRPGRAQAALPTAQSAAFIDSEPGDQFANGHQLTFNSVSLFGNSTPQSPGFQLSDDNTSNFYDLFFYAPTGSAGFTTGAYDTLPRPDATHASLSVSGAYTSGDLCGISGGRIIVDDVTYGSGGALQSFSARYEVDSPAASGSCSGPTYALFGAISYNSTADYRTRTISTNSIVVNTDGVTPANGSVTITNNGPSTLTPTGFTISGPNANQFAIAGNTCTGPLAAAGACTVTVRYTPSSTNASQETATLSFFDELAPQGPAGEPATVGTGRDIALVGNRATLAISPASASFGEARVGTYQTPGTAFTLTNQGAVPVTISGIENVGGNYLDFFGDTNCGDTLAAGASCTVTVYFAPTRLGTRRSNLVVYDNAVGGSQSASLSGTGTEGYYLAGAAGEVANFGDANYFGDVSNVNLAAPIVSITATTSNGDGYWLLGEDGGIFSFGNARFYGSTGGVRLNKPVLGMAATPTGHGYWLVASDGGIFAFGDARFFGSTGGITLAEPILGIAATPTGNGYWLVASDGGVFAFGDAPFDGSLGGRGITDAIGIAGTSPALDPYTATHAVALTPTGAWPSLPGSLLRHSAPRE